MPAADAMPILATSPMVPLLVSTWVTAQIMPTAPMMNSTTPITRMPTSEASSNTPLNQAIASLLPGVVEGVGGAGTAASARRGTAR